MYWQQIWFVLNMIFVALLIMFMFNHRSVTMARQEQDVQRLRSATRMRGIVGILTIVAFIAMITSFLINMRVNG
ncbi:hypothetical protein [Paenibacillus spongiae]|uniref:DUF2909 domain-containing protein n=1 Tax=Paenibacillus spongiae TaxID=2909671 RepID=A0ABY5SE61_9BACL|nr:hypothetical protein [Paenibacillus spongiae]UVI32256.1 hypothetical protein L1F29_10755 [Paenibacillus spongiae]